MYCQFLNQAHAAEGQARTAEGHARSWFLEIALVHASVCVCVCVCVSAPEGINNQGVIWCDIGRVQLVKHF